MLLSLLSLPQPLRREESLGLCPYPLPTWPRRRLPGQPPFTLRYQVLTSSLFPWRQSGRSSPTSQVCCPPHGTPSLHRPALSLPTPPPLAPIRPQEVNKTPNQMFDLGGETQAGVPWEKPGQKGTLHKARRHSLTTGPPVLPLCLFTSSPSLHLWWNIWSQYGADFNKTKTPLLALPDLEEAKEKSCGVPAGSPRGRKGDRKEEGAL